MTKKSGKPAQKSPSKLAKIGKKSGVELSESHLGQVTAGAAPKVKIDF
ncbi:MAG TPA: hypothetical protein VF495_21785 [Phenylobacterium sp.]